MSRLCFSPGWYRFISFFFSLIGSVIHLITFVRTYFQFMFCFFSTRNEVEREMNSIANEMRFSATSCGEWGGVISKIMYIFFYMLSSLLMQVIENIDGNDSYLSLLEEHCLPGSGKSLGLPRSASLASSTSAPCE